MDEFALYEEIKKSFTFKKGKILIFKINSDYTYECVPEVIDDMDTYCGRVNTFALEKQAYVAFDGLSLNDPIFVFSGKIFDKVEVISTGEIIDFAVNSQKPITAEDVKRDLKKLGSLLTNPQGSETLH